MEHNRDAIIKALECLTGEEVMFCRECGYNKVGAFSCRKELAKDALSLINELTEENEELLDTIACLEIDLDNARVDTVRAMKVRLNEKEYTNNYCQQIVLASDIDQIAKEMLGGDTFE